jgi:hypothetical protein
MKFRLAILAAALCLAFPNASRADTTYVLAVDYSSLIGVPGSTLDLQFSVPSILTVTTTGISPISNVSEGGALTGCVPSTAELDSPGSSSGDLIVNFAANCGPGDNFDGAAAFFDVPITSDGVYDAIGHHNSVAVGVIGTLTISSPEPSTTLLLAIGLLTLVGVSLRGESLQRRSKGAARRPLALHT